MRLRRLSTSEAGFHRHHEGVIICSVIAFYLGIAVPEVKTPLRMLVVLTIPFAFMVVGMVVAFCRRGTDGGDASWFWNGIGLGSTAFGFAVGGLALLLLHVGAGLFLWDLVRGFWR